MLLWPGERESFTASAQHGDLLGLSEVSNRMFYRAEVA